MHHQRIIMSLRYNEAQTQSFSNFYYLKNLRNYTTLLIDTVKSVLAKVLYFAVICYSHGYRLSHSRWCSHSRFKQTKCHFWHLNKKLSLSTWLSEDKVLPGLKKKPDLNKKYIFFLIKPFVCKIVNDKENIQYVTSVLFIKTVTRYLNVIYEYIKTRLIY